MESYWSRFASDFDAKQDYTVGAELNAAVEAKLRMQADLGKVLEFGCGNGRYTKSVLAASESVVATDYSAEMVAAARQILSAEPKVTVAQADCHQTDYDAHMYDTVMMANLIHIIDNPGAVIRESRRLLKPGGVLIVTCFSIEGMPLLSKLGLLFRYLKTFGAFPEHRTPFTLTSLRTLLTDERFEIEESVLLGKKSRAIFIKARNTALPDGRGDGVGKNPRVS